MSIHQQGLDLIEGRIEGGHSLADGGIARIRAGPLAFHLALQQPQAASMLSSRVERASRRPSCSSMPNLAASRLLRSCPTKPVRSRRRLAEVSQRRASSSRRSRSSDILLREFISGGPNEGDLAFVYEAGARQRAAEAAQRWPGGYRLLSPNPSIEAVPAAAVLGGAANGWPVDGERLVAFLTGPSGQEIQRGAGYREASDKVQGRDSQGIRLLPPPSQSEREELLRRWQRAGD